MVSYTSMSQHARLYLCCIQSRVKSVCLPSRQSRHVSASSSWEPFITDRWSQEFRGVLFISFLPHQDSGYPLGMETHDLDHHQLQGLWTEEETRLYINVLEFMAAHQACIMFLPVIQGLTIQIMTDNTITILCINWQGGAISRFWSPPP